MNVPGAVSFEVGEAVPWPRAHGGIAQVEECLRKNVGLLWRDDRGRLRRERVNAGRLHRYRDHNPLLLPLEPNPYGRGVIPRRKVFAL
jgi:hypothetical protein